MTREVIGHMDCPECGEAAEVKRTKAGLAYRWCTECNAQYFPRTVEASERLIGKCSGAKPAHTVTDKRTIADLAKDLRKAGHTTASAVHEDKPKPKAPDQAPAPAPAKPRSPFDDALAFLGGRA